MKTKIENARDFAHAAHDSIGQKRKDNKSAYWVHTDAVAQLVAEHGGTEDMVAAAHLHDVLEDVTPKEHSGRFNEAAIRRDFGQGVLQLVKELTNEFTPEKHPDKNRAARKNEERRRLKGISEQAKLIKLADILDNVSTLDGIQDVREYMGWARMWVQEKAEVVPALLTDGNRVLWEKVKKAVHERVIALNPRR